MWVVRAIVGAVALCAALDARAAGIESIEGCDVNFFRAEWVKENKASVSWSGACRKGLADGSGVVFLTAPDGTWARYVGMLAGGWASGDGDYRTTTGLRKVGRFESNLIAQGKQYAADGRLEFEGRFADGAFAEGTYWFADGSSARGEFEAGTTTVGAGGSGIAHAAMHDAAGAATHWWVGGTRYADLASYQAALASYKQYLVAKRAAEREAEEARAEAERLRREAEAAQTYNAIAGALLGVANAYVQQQAQQQPAYVPPPLPVWTPPAPSYAPPAPAYGAPAAPTKAHRPEFDARSCVMVEPNARGDGYQFVNRCSATVAITWCVVGNDCNPGYTNTWDLGVGSSWPIARGSSVNWAACARPASLYATTEMSRAMQHRCVVD